MPRWKGVPLCIRKAKLFQKSLTDFHLCSLATTMSYGHPQKQASPRIYFKLVTLSPQMKYINREGERKYILIRQLWLSATNMLKNQTNYHRISTFTLTWLRLNVIWEKLFTALCTKQIPGVSKKYNTLSLSEILLDIEDFNQTGAIRTQYHFS